MKKMMMLIVAVLALAPAGALYALTVSVESVTGNVEVKMGAGNWQAAQPGTQLSEGDQMATGFESTAVLKFEDNSVVNVEPLTQFTIDRFLKDDQAVHTDIALKIGEVKARVVRDGTVRSDFVVVTPSSVVSVRGTEEDVRSSDLGTQVTYHEGKGQAENTKGQRSFVAASQSANVATDGKITDAIQTSVNESRSLGTRDSGLTDAEVKIAEETFSDSTGDPGSAAEGQNASTDAGENLRPDESAS